MELEDLTTIDQLTAFLSGTQAVAFSVLGDKDARYLWIQSGFKKNWSNSGIWNSPARGKGWSSST